MVTEVTTAAADSLTNTAPMGERMALGLQTTLLGLGTVFAVLVILMVVLLLFRLFFYTIPNRKQHAAVDASPATPRLHLRHLMSAPTITAHLPRQLPQR